MRSAPVPGKGTSMLTRRVANASLLAAAAGLAPIGRATAADPVKFGVVTALSGDAGAYGKPFLDAIQILAAQFNQAGGVLGRPVQVVYYDDQGEPGLALQAAKKLVYDDHVTSLQPGSTSGAIFTAMPVGKEAKVAMWGYGLVRQWLVESEGMIFRSAAPDGVMLRGLARFGYEKKNLRRVAILHLDTFAGEASRDAFRDQFEASGGKISRVVSYTEGSRDFSSQFLTIARDRPDGLFLTVQPAALAPAVSQMRQFLPPNVVMMADNNFYVEKLRQQMGDQANGVYYYIHAAISQNQDKMVQDWIAACRAKLGDYSEIMARAQVGMTVMREAIERAKGTDGIAVMKEVHRMKDFPTVMGNFTYDPRDGEGLKTGLVMQAKAGADLARDEIVDRPTTAEALYDKRVDFTKYFGAGYREQLYALHGVA